MPMASPFKVKRTPHSVQWIALFLCVHATAASAVLEEVIVTAQKREQSLIEVPGQMTHLSTAGSPLEVPDALVRLSVGIESVEDLLDDLRWALDAAG